MKKKFELVVILITLILLLVTNSLYIEWDELIIITISSIIIVSKSLVAERQVTNHSIIVVLRSLVFVVCYVVFDLIADYQWYVRGIADGRHLKLSETFSEFGNDLMIIVPAIILVVLTVSMLVSFICETVYNKKTN